MTKQVLQQALEALEYAAERVYSEKNDDCIAVAIEALREALAQPNEADELLRNLHLDPERYRTEGGAINHLKVRAAILNPRDYCDHEWKTAPASLGGELCNKCGRMK